MMRVLVCGGRDYTDKMYLWAYLDGFGPPEITEVVSGMAKGADSFAAEWAERFGFPLHKFPYRSEFGLGGGHIRNQQMLDEGKPDVVIAFPGGKGTADMVKRARFAGVEVIEVK